MLSAESQSQASACRCCSRVNAVGAAARAVEAGARCTSRRPGRWKLVSLATRRMGAALEVRRASAGVPTRLSSAQSSFRPFWRAVCAVTNSCWPFFFTSSRVLDTRLSGTIAFREDRLLWRDWRCALAGCSRGQAAGCCGSSPAMRVILNIGVGVAGRFYEHANVAALRIKLVNRRSLPLGGSKTPRIYTRAFGLPKQGPKAARRGPQPHCRLAPAPAEQPLASGEELASLAVSK